MKYYKTFMLFSFLFISWTSEINGQEIRDILKEQLRKSLITPETPMQHQQHQIEHQRHQEDVLKVSPFTKLPTKGDRIKLFKPLEDYQIHINLNVTNSAPINQLPRGSVRYEFVGKNMQMISTAGTMVVPSGNGGGPIRKRHKKNANILKALQK